jgi:VWFA-related protein
MSVRRKGFIIRSSAVVAMTAGLAVLVAAGGPQEQRQRPLRHDTAAVVKLVPVRVLDPEGRPVRGLTKADFALTDNGESRTITEFEVHESGGRLVAPEAAEPAAGAVPAGSSRRVFFVLDMQSSDLFGNRDAKNAVLAFVMDNLRPGDEASVITFGAITGLVLRQYLTSDVAKIESAIKRSIEMAGASGILRRSTSPIDVENIASTGRMSQVTIATAPFGYDEEGLSLETPPGRPPGSDRTKADFDRSMAELATTMRFIPGSKSVIYFSIRVPGPEVGRLFAEANATVFAVNTNSVRPDGPARVRKLKEEQGEALRAFSESSGGSYFADVRDAKKLAADIEVLSGSYYVLGYYVTPAWDGRQHAIAVTVRRPGVEVLAQAGYNDPKPYAALSDLEKKLQLFDLLLSDEPVGTETLDLPVRVLWGSATKDMNAAVLIRLEVDERTGIPPGLADLYVLVFDADHKIVLAERGEIDTRIMGQRVLYPYLLAKLPPGDYECRVAARDKDNGYALSARTPFAVPAPARPPRCSLASPLLLVRAEKPAFVRMSRPLPKGREPLSILDFYPYLPQQSVPLLGAFSEDSGQVAVLLPFLSGGPRPSSADLQVRMTDAAGGPDIPIKWVTLDCQRREPDMTYFLIRIDVGRLGPGGYRLDFRATDPSSRADSSASAVLVKR